MGKSESTELQNRATNSRGISDDTRATDDDQRGLAAQEHAAARRQQGFGVNRDALRREAERAEKALRERIAERRMKRGQQELVDMRSLRAESKRLGERLDKRVERQLESSLPRDDVEMQRAPVSREAFPIGYSTEDSETVQFPTMEHFSPILDFLGADEEGRRRLPNAPKAAAKFEKWWQDSFGDWPVPRDFRRLSIVTPNEISINGAIKLLTQHRFKDILKPDEKTKLALAQKGIGQRKLADGSRVFENGEAVPKDISDAANLTWKTLATARLSDPRFTKSVIYVGPGLAVFFDTAGNVLTGDLPVTLPAVVEKVIIPGKVGARRFTDGIYYSFGRELTAALAFEPAVLLPRGVGLTFYKTFVQGERFTLQNWRGADGKGVVIVINGSFWYQEPRMERWVRGPGRIDQAHAAMITRGYLVREIANQAAEFVAKIRESPAEELSSLFLQFVLSKVNPFPSPEDFAWTLDVLLTWQMATLGRENAAADIDVAARLLAHLYALPFVMFLVSKGLRVAKNRLHPRGGPKTPARTSKGSSDSHVSTSSEAKTHPRTGATVSESDIADAKVQPTSVRRSEDVGLRLSSQSKESSPQRSKRRNGREEDEVVSPTGERLDERPGNTEQAGQRSSSHVKETSPQEFRTGTREVGDRARSTPNTDAARHTTAEKNPHNQSSLPESERMRGNQGTTPVTGAPKSIGQLRQQLGKSRYEVLKRKAKSYLKRYREATATKERKSVIDTVKGYIFESLIPKLGIHERMIRRSKHLAKMAGVDPESLKFTSDVRDRVGGSDLSRPTSKGELTDGIIYGTRKRKIKEGGKIKEVDEIVIFVVYESKSLRNFLRILKEKNNGGGVELGQAERTRARLDSIESTGIVVDGKQYASERVILPPDLGYRMPIIGVVPKDLSAKSRNNLETAMTKEGHEIVENQQRDFHVVESPLTNDDAFELAKEVLDELDAESD
jgi:hypothetical protein